MDLDGFLLVTVASPFGRFVDVVDAQPGTCLHVVVPCTAKNTKHSTGEGAV